MKLINCFFIILFTSISAFAQPTFQNNKVITIGETIPDVLISNLKNYSSETIRFSSFQKELTILDFWSTVCGSCIESFPKMHALQSKFAGKLQLLMVNTYQQDDEKKIATFFERRKTRTGKDFMLPYLLQDSLFLQFFPHKVIPHCVWIDKDRKVLAITHGSAVTETNILAVLNGNSTKLELKNDDLLFDETKDRLLAGDKNETDGLIYRSFITVEKKEKGSTIFFETAGEGRIQMMRIMNHSLLRLYQKANKEIFNHGIEKLVIDPEIATAFQLDLDEKLRSRFCYEMQSPPITRKQALEWLAADLKRCFRIEAVAEERMVKCFVISAGATFNKLQTKGAVTDIDYDQESIRPHITNGKMDELVTILKIILKQPVIDETGAKQHIDIVLPKGVFSFNQREIKDFLTTNGIELETTKKMLWVPRLKAVPSNK